MNSKVGLGKSVLDSSGSGYVSVAGSCEDGNKPSGSIKGGNFFTT
jgi:hypothetical protein